MRNFVVLLFICSDCGPAGHTDMAGLDVRLFDVSDQRVVSALGGRRSSPERAPPPAPPVPPPLGRQQRKRGRTEGQLVTHFPQLNRSRHSINRVSKPTLTLSIDFFFKTISLSFVFNQQTVSIDSWRFHELKTCII